MLEAILVGFAIYVVVTPLTWLMLMVWAGMTGDDLT